MKGMITNLFFSGFSSVLPAHCTNSLNFNKGLMAMVILKQKKPFKYFPSDLFLSHMFSFYPSKKWINNGVLTV